MCSLGYNDNLTGTWPVNYVTQANKDGILDDVTIVASAAAKRADVVVMLDETLDTDIVTYDKDTNEFVKKQTTIAGSSYITLLEDSFKGTYLEIDKFDRVEQVRDAAKETLNWTVSYVTGYDEEKEVDITDSKTLIIDKDTKVSYNGGTLFDLENHQGKVYYVKESDKYYARFIEVESYTKLVSDEPTLDGNKVKVGKTSYNAVSSPDMTSTTSKNSKWVMYFNDDDQVYMTKSDKDFTEKAYYVKSVGSNSVKLVAGVKASTANMKDDDTLIWDGTAFIAPSELKAGDAVMEIAENDLYVKVAEATGELTRVTTSTGKATIGGSSYVYGAANTTMNFIDDTFEDAGIDADEVYGNTVKFIQNKDNSIAAIMVDETSTGTTLYGIVTDGGSSSSSWADAMDSITIFTSEGKTVKYELDDDPTYLEVNANGETPSDSETTYEIAPTKEWMGQLVAYQLNKDGEIKKLLPLGTVDATVNDSPEKVTAGKDLLGVDTEITVDNNTYLKGNGKTITLASNAIIFEVDVDSKGKVDPAIVNRASLLSGGDFTPSTPTDKMKINDNYVALTAYAVYDTNSNGAAKVLAYTEAGTSDYHYGVVDAWNFSDADNDHAVTLDNDDTVYELGNADINAATDEPVNGDDLIVYTLSGDKITVVLGYGEDDAIAEAGLGQEVQGFTDGLITVDQMAVAKDLADPQSNDYKPNAAATYTSFMTDNDTVVYVINGSTGDYELGELADIAKGSYVYIPVVDEDGYADIVIVDEYGDYDAIATANSAKPAPIVTGATVTWDGTAGTAAVEKADLDAAKKETDKDEAVSALKLTIGGAGRSTAAATAWDKTKAELTITVTAKDSTTATYTITFTEAK